MTSTTSEVWKKQQQQRKPQRDLEVEHDDDVPPEVPKRTSSKVCTYLQILKISRNCNIELFIYFKLFMLQFPEILSTSELKL